MWLCYFVICCWIYRIGSDYELHYIQLLCRDFFKYITDIVRGKSQVCSDGISCLSRSSLIAFYIRLIWKKSIIFYITEINLANIEAGALGQVAVRLMWLFCLCNFMTFFYGRQNWVQTDVFKYLFFRNNFFVFYLRWRINLIN